jgi:hypothetical protein
VNRELIADAKRRLPLPALLTQLGHGAAAKKSAKCPLHEDGRESFSMFQRADSSWAWKCHAGCGGGDEIELLACVRTLSSGDAIREFLKLAGVSDSRPAAAENSRRIVATYDYRDAAGNLLFEVVRFEPKTFRQRRPDPTAADGWSWKLDGVERVLYRLPEIAATIAAGKAIHIAEGEKDVESLVAHGFEATCNPGGASKWLDAYSESLRGADVVILPDKDEPGRKHAQLIAGKLHGTAQSLRIVELPDVEGRPVKDAAGFFAAGGTAGQLAQLIEATLLEEAGEEPAATVPVFPLDALPPTLALIASNIARSARVPERLAGPCVLGLVSAALGAGLQVQSDTNRTTRGNSYFLISAETGTGKSRSFELIAAPLLDHQRRLSERWRTQTGPRLQAELRLLERDIAEIEKRAAKAQTEADRERLCGELEYKLARKDELTARCHAPVIIAQDATTERLTSMMAEQNEVLFSASSDCRKVVDNLLGRYASNGSTDESLYLSAFSGDLVRVDRGSRPPVELHHPCLSLLWFGQPDLVDTIFGEESLSASGFLQRLLICHSQAAPQRIDGESAAVPERVTAAWSALLTDLLATYHEPAAAFTIQPTAEAHAALIGFHNEIVDRRQQGELADVGGFAARWAEQAWRLSVVLHAGFHGAEAHQHDLSAETAHSAIQLARWFSDEQLAILAKGRRAAAEKLEVQVFALLETTRERKGRDWITARDVQRAYIVPSAERARTLLAAMEQDGSLIGTDTQPAGGGKVTRQFRSARQRNPVPG